MIFSILQISRDRKRLLTASVQHLSSVIYCKKGHCLEIVKFNGCTRERHSAALICFGQTSAKFLPKTNKQHYCGDLGLGWAVLQKTVFNH